MSLLAMSLNKVYGYDVYEVILYITDLLLLLFCVFNLYNYYYNNIMLMMTMNMYWFHLSDLRIFIPLLHVKT